MGTVTIRLSKEVARMRQRLFVLLISLLVAVLAAPVIAAAQNTGPDDVQESEESSDDGTEEESEEGTEEESEDGTEEESGDDEADDHGRQVEVDRVFGPDRFSTSVAISQYEFPGGASEVYLARADNFADAVSAGALKKGPVLLVPQCGELPEVVAAELARLHPRKVVALGGPGAVCEDVLNAAADAAAAGQGADDVEDEETEAEETETDAEETETDAEETETDAEETETDAEETETDAEIGNQ